MRYGGWKISDLPGRWNEKPAEVNSAGFLLAAI
jgi:hypothetical protein